MSADANRRLPFSRMSHLLCCPSLTEGATDPGNGGSPRPVLCRAVSACYLASGQEVWLPSCVGREMLGISSMFLSSNTF